jgi:hypothetical protein
LYVYSVDNVVWDSQGSNFVHKRKEEFGACSKCEERCVQVLMSKLEGRRILGRPRCRRQDNIKIIIKGVKW